MGAMNKLIRQSLPEYSIKQLLEKAHIKRLWDPKKDKGVTFGSEGNNHNLVRIRNYDGKWELEIRHAWQQVLYWNSQTNSIKYDPCLLRTRHSRKVARAALKQIGFKDWFLIVRATGQPEWETHPVYKHCNLGMFTPIAQRDFWGSGRSVSVSPFATFSEGLV